MVFPFSQRGAEIPKFWSNYLCSPSCYRFHVHCSISKLQRIKDQIKAKCSTFQPPPIKNWSASKATGVENQGQISYFLTLVKLRGEVQKREMERVSEWILRARHRTKPLIYFWWGGIFECGHQKRKDASKTDLPWGGLNMLTKMMH